MINSCSDTEIKRKLLFRGLCYKFERKMLIAFNNNHMKKTKVLALMTCYNRKEKTKKAITSLMAGNRNVEFEFIIVDDNSSDGTYDEMKKFRNITVLKGNGNLFYSGGMRVAIQAALNCGNTYDFCLLVNDDVEFFENAIENLCAKKGGGIWVGPTCDNNRRLSYGGIKKKSNFLPRFEIVKANNDKGMLCDTFNANCVLIDWQVFVNLKNIDRKYSHSLGDFDYGFSAKKQGVQIMVSNEFVGICCDNPVKGGWRDASLARWQRIKLKESPKGLPSGEWFHYLNKNYGIITAILYSFIPYIRIVFGK